MFARAEPTIVPNDMGAEQATPPLGGPPYESSGAAPDSVKACLAQVRSQFGEEIEAIESELSRLVRLGTAPGTDAAAHLLEAGGKRVRPLTVILSAACFGKPNQTVRDVAVVAELVHLATLLHDDVIDDGKERRGRPTSRRIWGNAISVLSGDMLLTLALERTAASAPGFVLHDLFATLRRLVDGEILQLRGRGTLELDEASYFRIIRGKTASLFEWAARAGAACAGATPQNCAALGEFGARVGLAFQLVDDVLDYCGDPRDIGKALLGDLAEGKLTLPLIRTLEKTPAIRPHVHAARTGDHESALLVADAVRASGTCDSVRALAREQSSLALEPLKTLPPSAARDLLASIARELAARAS